MSIKYQVTSCCDFIRTAVARLFRRTNRYYIKKVLEANMAYLNCTSFPSSSMEPVDSSEDEDDDTKPFLNSRAASNPIRVTNSRTVDTKPLSRSTNGDFIDSSKPSVVGSSAGVLGSLHMSGCFDRILDCYRNVTGNPTEEHTEDAIDVKNRKHQAQELSLQQPSCGGQKVMETLKNEKIEAFGSVLEESRKPILPKKYGANEHKAAIMFQAAYRGYKVRQACAKQKRKVNVFGRYTMQHLTKKDRLGNPLLYYFDKEGVAKPVRMPMASKALPQSYEKGASKRVFAKDKVSVELGPLSKKEGDQLIAVSREVKYSYDAKEYREIAQHLAPYTSCCPSVPINDDTIIVKNGGKNMKQMIMEGVYVELKCFKGACKDMAHMHLRRIYLRDIKLENMTLSPRGHALFIDTDDTAVPTLDNYRQFKGTTAMTTQKLIEQKRVGKLEFIEADSNYAMLLLMTEATSEALRGQKETKDTTGGVAFKISRVNGNNRELYRNWVDAHVKVEYRDNVMNFLLNPAENRLNASIVDVMDWST